MFLLLLLNAGIRKDQKRDEMQREREQIYPLVLNIGSKKSTIITTRGSRSIFFFFACLCAIINVMR